MFETTHVHQEMNESAEGCMYYTMECYSVQGRIKL